MSVQSTLRTWMLAALCITALAACQQPIVRPAEPAYHTDPKEAVDFLATALVQKIGTLPSPRQKVIPVDEFFNVHSAEISSSGHALQQQLATVLTQQLSPLQFSPLNSKSVANAQWVVLSSYATPKAGEAAQSGKWVRLQIALAETATGDTLIRVDTFLDAKQFNADPTRFFKDAPMFLTDQRHREKVDVMSGQKRPLNQVLQVHSTFTEAIAAYEAGRYAEAEQGFSMVHKLAPDHPGALTGLYQTYWQMGRKAEAEQAFAKLVNVGIDAGALSVKLLFKVASTEYVDSPDLVAQYRLWLKSIGQGVVAKDRCVDVNGHASKSGASDFNSRLSLQRAERIVTQVVQATPPARTRFKAIGKGYEDAIVGTGADDASDAIDRRVEFRVKGCTR